MSAWPDRALDEIGDAFAVETAQGNAIDTLGAAQVREQGTEGMRPVDLGVAVCADHQQVQVAIAPQHVTKHEQGRLRRPVQIIEHEQRRREL